MSHIIFISSDSGVVAGLIAINVFLFVILLALMAVIIALAKRLHAKHSQCTCKRESLNTDTCTCMVATR